MYKRGTRWPKPLCGNKQGHDLTLQNLANLFPTSDKILDPKLLKLQLEKLRIFSRFARSILGLLDAQSLEQIPRTQQIVSHVSRKSPRGTKFFTWVHNTQRRTTTHKEGSPWVAQELLVHAHAQNLEQKLQEEQKMRQLGKACSKILAMPIHYAPHEVNHTSRGSIMDLPWRKSHNLDSKTSIYMI